MIRLRRVSSASSVRCWHFTAAVFKSLASADEWLQLSTVGGRARTGPRWCAVGQLRDDGSTICSEVSGMPWLRKIRSIKNIILNAALYLRQNDYKKSCTIETRIYTFSAQPWAYLHTSSLCSVRLSWLVPTRSPDSDSCLPTSALLPIILPPFPPIPTLSLSETQQLTLYISKETKMPIQLAQCRFPGLAVSGRKI